MTGPHLPPSWRRLREERGLVGRALVLSILVIVVLGIAAIDGGSMLFTSFKVADVSQAAATAGAAELQSTGSLTRAREAARTAAHERDAKSHMTRFRLRQGGVVEVTIAKTASTLIVQRVGFLKDLGVIHSTSTSGPPTI